MSLSLVSFVSDHVTRLSQVSPWLTNSSVLNYVNHVNTEANRLKLVSIDNEISSFFAINFPDSQLHDAAEGLLYLHTRSVPIIHGDLKCVSRFTSLFAMLFDYVH